MGFGKGHAHFVGGLAIGFEELVLVDQPTERIGCNLGTREMLRFNAQALKQGKGDRFAVELWTNGFNGRQHILKDHLANLAFVGSGSAFHDRDAVFLIPAIPGLDGSPCEAPTAALLIGKVHFADRFNTGMDRASGGHVNGSKYTHFQISCGIAHKVFCFAHHAMKPRSHPGTVFSCCCSKKSSCQQNPAMPVRSGFETRAHVRREKAAGKNWAYPKKGT